MPKRSPDGVDELAVEPWFRDYDFVARLPPPHLLFRGDTGREDYFQVRPDPPALSEKRCAVHERHEQIRDEQIDRMAGFDHVQRLMGIRRRDQPAAHVTKCFCNGRNDEIFVVHSQHSSHKIARPPSRPIRLGNHYLTNPRLITSRYILETRKGGQEMETGSERFRQVARQPRRLLQIHHLLIGLVFTLIILGLLVVANIGMDVLTSMRAYVGGEGLWSKAQKDAVRYLLRYGGSRSEEDYRRFLLAIAVPLADHEARLEMAKPAVDRARAAAALIAGRNHPDDVQGMVNLFLRYHS
ncbi:MAG TPA: hypothetical protein VL285_25245, partial [Bryobacteraceae bacterium]|nr:hypothetical protein [Bryobacteraceae bacterium]